MTGLSKSVIRSRDALIRSQIEAHTPNNESYSLIAKAVNVGVALLVYAREDTVASIVRDVQTQWAACGPAWMGNKGAVAVRFRIDDEVYTFVNAHLTAHLPNYERRTQDWADIVSSTLFPPLPRSKSKAYSTIYDSTHVFFFGDLNFRLDVPKTLNRPDFERMARTAEGRKQLLQYDQLVRAQREGRIPPMKEAPLWDFQPTYKFLLNHVDTYRYVRFAAFPMSQVELKPRVEQRTTPPSMDRPHPLRICLRPIFHPIIYPTAAIHFHTVVYNIRSQARHSPPPSSPLIGRTTTRRGRTTGVNNVAPPSTHHTYGPTPRREVCPRPTMAAQALVRQDSEVADGLAVVFDRFARSGEHGCGRRQFLPGMCGNLFVD